MQLGIRLHDVKQSSGEGIAGFEERIEEVKRLDFKCGHLALSKMGIPSSPESLTPGYAMTLRRIFDKNEVDVAVLGCYLNLADPDPARLSANTEKYLANIRFASHLGAGMVGTETGAPNSEYKFCPECRTDEALHTFITNLRPVVGYAEKCGVLISIEPVAKHIVYDAKRARRVLDEIASPNLRIIFDPVNLLDRSNFEDRERIFAETMELLEKDIAMVHLKDFKVPSDGGELISVGCGQGEMDYTEILKFVKSKKQFIHATLENTKPDNCESCRDLILDTYARV